MTRGAPADTAARPRLTVPAASPRSDELLVDRHLVLDGRGLHHVVDRGLTRGPWQRSGRSGILDRMTLDLPGERIAELCERYGITELSVFGSVARGDDTPQSDVDLLYVLSPDARLGWEIVDLRDNLEEMFGRRVDLVPKSGLKWLIRDRVLAEARVIYAA
jgi:hypothetical protein